MAIGYASSGLVALVTSRTRRMEEQQEILSQLFERNLYDVARARKPGVSISNTPFGLEAPRP